MVGMEKNLGLQGRFLLGLAFILFAANLLASGFIYHWGKQNIEEEALKRSELVMAALDSIRDYVSEELRPRMYEVLGSDSFVLEAMSTSYVSRAVMDRLRQKVPELYYRRVSSYPINQAYYPNELEETLLAYFQQNPAIKDWQGIVPVNGTQFYMRFEPVSYDKKCMRCHGNRLAAPTEIPARYRNASFLPDDINVPALTSVGIPLDTGLLQIKDRAFSVFAFAFFFIVLLYSIISFFFDRIVVKSLRNLLSLFRQSLKDEKGEQLYKIASSRDAIDEITTAAESMANYIIETNCRLAAYANNLELIVEERTTALKLSQRQLQEKVKSRNRELHTLNSISELITRSNNLAPILPEILHNALGVVPADGAALYLLHKEEDQFILEQQCAEKAGELRKYLIIESGENADCGNSEEETLESSLREAACGQMSFLASEDEKIDSLSVPLCCRSHIHGVMIFMGVNFMKLDAEVTTLLSSVGQQIGILIESMHNIHKLVQNATMLQSIFDGIDDLVVLLDPSLQFKMINRAFMVRYPQVNNAASLLDLTDNPFKNLTILTDLQHHLPVTQEIYTENGLIYEVHFYPIPDEDGQLESIVCHGKDITEQKRAEERSQHTEKMAGIGQMAAGIAHEINNPLGVILCYTDLARNDVTNLDQLEQDINIIEKHAHTCRGIVVDLLQFARGGETVKAPDSLNNAVAEVIAIMKRQMNTQQITLVTDFDDSLPPMDMDKKKIKQVILNLIINAAQAIGSNGTISVTTVKEKDGTVKIQVEDDGPGIANEIIGKIFDPFFSTKPPGRGTGLGLSVSYGIISEHDGIITAENKNGGGCCLTISFPAKPS